MTRWINNLQDTSLGGSAKVQVEMRGDACVTRLELHNVTVCESEGEDVWPYVTHDSYTYMHYIYIIYVLDSQILCRHIMIVNGAATCISSAQWNLFARWWMQNHCSVLMINPREIPMNAALILYASYAR